MDIGNFISASRDALQDTISRVACIGCCVQTKLAREAGAALVVIEGQAAANN
jgi:hypothetical protein